MNQIYAVALRIFAGLFVVGACMQSAHAVVSAFLSPGDTCNAGTSVPFSETGGAFRVTLCASTTAEGVCGATIFPKIGAASENGHFKIIGRTLGSAIPDASSALVFPMNLNSVPDYLQNFGGSRTQAIAPLAAVNQVLATFEILPQSSATNSSYVFSLDGASEINHALTGSNCFTDFSVDPMTPSITLVRGTPPQFSSAENVTFTVGFAGSFQVNATGSPIPGLTIGGAALPANVTFAPATGILSGTSQLGTVGTYNVTFTAANSNLPNGTQNFTLTVQKANQAINFDPLADRPFSATTFNVSATATSGQPVAFASATASNCSVSGNTVTMLATGTCMIVASQMGNANFNPAAPISRSFQITGLGPYLVTPSAGSNGTISPSTAVAVSHGATAMFTVTPNSGFVAAVSGTCGGSLSGNTYTTAAVTAPCTVIASFAPLITYNLALEGAQEDPANISTGTGSGTAVVDTVNNTITLNVTFSGIGALTGAHLHGPVARGIDAGVKISLTDLTSPISEALSYSEADEADILAGKWYLNLHTAAYPGGELRAQLDNLGAANQTLSTTVVGTGTITGAGINCPGDCTESYTHNTMVALTAAPGANFSFTGWSGACFGTGACNVTMDFLKSVTVTFTLYSYVVTGTASPMAGGTVNCTSPVNHGATTTCTATPNAGYTLSNISGCNGMASTMSPYTTGAITAACAVTATFTANITFQSAVSRKNHGAAAGDRDITLLHAEPIGGNVTAEPRAAQSGGHLIVFIFSSTVNSHATPVIVDGASVSITPISVTPVANELRIVLPALPDGSRADVRVSGVNGVLDVATTIGFLYGDVTNSRMVTAADIAATKAASNLGFNATNFRADINLNGTINAIDVSAIKSRAGQVLP